MLPPQTYQRKKQQLEFYNDVPKQNLLLGTVRSEHTIFVSVQHKRAFLNDLTADF